MAQDTTSTTDAPAEQGEETEETVEEHRDERREQVLEELRAGLGNALIDTHIDPGTDMWARVSIESWAQTAEVVRYRLGARYFGFLSVIDWLPSPYGRSMDSEVDKVFAGAEPGVAEAGDDEESAGMRHGVTGGESRFQMLARVAKVGEPHNHWGITLKADIPHSLEVATWTGVYAGADWHEREAWEMYGVHFVGHPGLRHIYLPSDFEGYPLRKDYPLIARIVKPWPGIVDVEALPEVADVGSAGEASSDSTGGEAASEDPARSQPPSDDSPAGEAASEDRADEAGS